MNAVMTNFFRERHPALSRDRNALITINMGDSPPQNRNTLAVS